VEPLFHRLTYPFVDPALVLERITLIRNVLLLATEIAIEDGSSQWCCFLCAAVVACIGVWTAGLS